MSDVASHIFLHIGLRLNLRTRKVHVSAALASDPARDAERLARVAELEALIELLCYTPPDLERLAAWAAAADLRSASSPASSPPKIIEAGDDAAGLHQRIKDLERDQAKGDELFARQVARTDELFEQLQEAKKWETELARVLGFEASPGMEKLIGMLGFFQPIPKDIKEPSF